MPLDSLRGLRWVMRARPSASVRPASWSPP